MLFKEVVESWEKDNWGSTTITQFRGKIKKYLNLNFNMTIDEALNETRLFYFILFLLMINTVQRENIMHFTTFINILMKRYC